MSSVPRRARRLAALVFATATAATAAVIAGDAPQGGGATARAAADVTITAHDFFWSPDTVSIQVGDTVTWTNEQGFHNVLLGDSRLNAPGFPPDPPWNPPPQMTFNEEGSYTFICEVHPGMTGTVNVGDGGGEPTPTPTPTPTPGVPPPGGAPPDTTAPTVGGLTVAGFDSRVQVRLTLDERATVNVRFVTDTDVITMRRQVEAGTWTLERPLARGTYSYELWAVDAMGNRSATHPGEVRVRA
jgi:plastocyanin